ncbi:MAG: hypothetical protein ACRENB_04550 [Gemmatimonadales bacterium]
MSRILVAGLALTSSVALLTGWLWGRQAAIAATIFGLGATAIQMGALALLRNVRGAPVARFLQRWGAGMGLRLLGVLAIAVAAGIDPVMFPPLAAALGFLGVLLPLLVYEVRLIR